MQFVMGKKCVGHWPCPFAPPGGHGQ
jgi:hypothetical protein